MRKPIRVVTEYIKLPEIQNALSSLQPKIKPQIKTAIIVPRKANDYRLIGTAFDYRMRIEIKKISKSSKLNLMGLTELNVTPHFYINIFGYPKWDIDQLKKYNWFTDDENCETFFQLNESHEFCNHLNIEKFFKTIHDIQSNIRNNIDNYLSGETVEINKSCLQLALLDRYFRSHHLDPDFHIRNHENEEEELESLVRIVPDDILDSKSHFLLNPVVGDEEISIWGDCDIIKEDNLIDRPTQE